MSEKNEKFAQQWEEGTQGQEKRELSGGSGMEEVSEHMK